MSEEAEALDERERLMRAGLTSRVRAVETLIVALQQRGLWPVRPGDRAAAPPGTYVSADVMVDLAKSADWEAKVREDALRRATEPPQRRRR